MSCRGKSNHILQTVNINKKYFETIKTNRKKIWRKHTALWLLSAIWFVIVLNCIKNLADKINKYFKYNHNKQTENLIKFNNSIQKLVLDSFTSCIFYVINCSITKPVKWCNKTHYDEIVENQVFLNDLGLDSSACIEWGSTKSLFSSKR